MSLLDTDVPIQDVITTDPEKAKALENDVRAKILDMLADEAMTISEIRAELDRRGEDKAETTVRHHIDVLEDAGMVELARLEEVGGGTLKFYKSNTRIFSYDLPESHEDQLDEVTDTVREELQGVVERLCAEHGDEIETIAREMKPCEYCDTEHYEEFILRELVSRSLTQLSEDGTLDDLLTE